MKRNRILPHQIACCLLLSALALPASADSIPTILSQDKAFLVSALLHGINEGRLSETDCLPTASRAWSELLQSASRRDDSFKEAEKEYRLFRERKAHVRQLPITITNNSDRQQQHIVEVGASAVAKALGTGQTGRLLIRNAAGQEIDCQLTHDGKLLIDASVQPHSSWTVYAEAGQPRQPREWVQGAQYRIRKDDIAWENDRCAYRVYGPALQATGEKSYGIDVWVKNTPDLVLDDRYAKDHQSYVDSQPMITAGRTEEGQLFHNEGSFHLDHGNGFDGYGVGPTLGCGTPALIDDGKLMLPYCYTNYTILDNRPLRFSVRLDYGANAEGLNPGEHRIITLDKGSHFNKITVWYDSLNHPVTFCAGIVLNKGGQLQTSHQYVAYADITDRPDITGSTIYVATLFPKNQVKIGKTPDGDNAVGMITGYKGQPITYYAGAGWSRYDVPDMEVWRHLIETAMEKEALTVTIGEPCQVPQP